MGSLELPLWVAGAVVLALNLPFGFWRSRVKKFSLLWFLAIHLPVPLVVLVRMFGGLGWHLVTFPVLVGAFACGQFLGGRVIGPRIRKPASPSS